MHVKLLKVNARCYLNLHAFFRQNNFWSRHLTKKKKIFPWRRFMFAPLSKFQKDPFKIDIVKTFPNSQLYVSRTIIPWGLTFKFCGKLQAGWLIKLTQPVYTCQEVRKDFLRLTQEWWSDHFIRNVASFANQMYAQLRSAQVQWRNVRPM